MPESHGASIELENLTKRYPGSPQPSVDNVSMEIRAGETVVFVGPSGCGKSTTLKMINRLIEPSGGRIRIDGEDVEPRRCDDRKRAEEQRPRRARLPQRRSTEVHEPGRRQYRR